MLSRSIFLTIVLCTVFMGNSPASDHTYANEVEIVFENDGQKVQAFEGSIQVPENRSDKNSRLIPLHYLRFPATGKNPGPPTNPTTTATINDAKRIGYNNNNNITMPHRPSHPQKMNAKILDEI